MVKGSYYYRKDNHLCVRCGIPLPDNYTRVSCPDCLKRQQKYTNKETKAVYEKETRQWRIEHHYCTRCGKKDAYTTHGRKICFDCAEYMREYDKSRYKERFNEYGLEKHRNAFKNRYNNRKNNGLCVKCQRPLNSSGKTLCDHCLTKKRKEGAIRRNTPSQGYRQERNELGVCVICGTQIDPFLMSINGKSKLCQRCYDVACTNLKKAQEALALYPEKNLWKQDAKVDWIRRHGTK